MGASLCDFSPPLCSYWPPPSKPQQRGSPNSKRFVFCDICYLLLAHCFGGGGVMLKFLGAVDHALFDTITHFFHGECHQCHFPHFFWGGGVLEPPKFVLSLRQQVADFTASEKVGEEVARLVSPSLFKCFCVNESPFGCRVCCPLSRLGLPFGALWWDASGLF